MERTADVVFSGVNGDAFTLLRMSASWSEDARSRLVEHHYISYDLLKYVQRSAAMVSSAGTVTVMLNEEDHVRFQGLLPGLAAGARGGDGAESGRGGGGEDTPSPSTSQLGLPDGVSGQHGHGHALLCACCICRRWPRAARWAR